MRATVAAAALLLLVALAHAQAPVPPKAPEQTAAEMSSHDAPATFSTKVNLVMVPVIVRDSKGKAVGTLQKEDFQLFDKGKPQVIAKFSVEKAGEALIPAEVAEDAALEKATGEGNAAPAKAPPVIAQRFVVYLFDDVHTGMPDLIQARDAAIRHLTESLDPATRAALLTTSGQGNVDFTDDRVALQQALLKLMARPTLGGSGIGMPGRQLLHGRSDQ